MVQAGGCLCFDDVFFFSAVTARISVVRMYHGLHQNL